MAILEMTKEKAAKLSETEDLALGIIKDALSGTIDAGDDCVKVASKMLGVAAKNRQTLTNRSAIEFSMASSVGTEKELKNYIAVTNPKVRKALGGKA